jgi:hypothetical protein
MIEGLDADVVGTDEAAQRRDEIVAEVTDHAGEIARELARLQGGDYGQATFETDTGSWTLKYEAGDVQYLRFERGGREIYVVSTQQPPEPSALATAMIDYDAFVAAFNDHVRSLDGVLDDVSTEFPEIDPVDDVVATRQAILSDLREACDAMAQQLYRYSGDSYGTFSARVGGSRWELNWEEGRADYLRVGGEGGVYLLSQYQPPSAHDLRAHADDVSEFVAAYNDHVREISESLETVSL